VHTPNACLIWTFNARTIALLVAYANMCAITHASARGGKSELMRPTSCHT